MDTKGLHFLIGGTDWDKEKLEKDWILGLRRPSNCDNGTPVQCSFD